jgi:hypothetical protein
MNQDKMDEHAQELIGKSGAGLRGYNQKCVVKCALEADFVKTVTSLHIT